MLEENSFHIISGCLASDHALRLLVYYNEEARELKGRKYKVYTFIRNKWIKTHNIKTLAT
jgi:hypothetical protein